MACRASNDNATSPFPSQMSAHVSKITVRTISRRIYRGKADGTECRPYQDDAADDTAAVLRVRAFMKILSGAPSSPKRARMFFSM